MFDLMETMLTQLIECLPVLFGVYLIFYFLGELLFPNRR